MRKSLVVFIALALSSSVIAIKPAAAGKPAAPDRAARGEVIVKLKENARNLLGASPSPDLTRQANPLLDAAQVVAESAGSLRQENLGEAIQPLVPSFGDGKAKELAAQFGLDRTVVLSFAEGQDIDAVIDNLRAN